MAGDASVHTATEDNMKSFWKYKYMLLTKRQHYFSSHFLTINQAKMLLLQGMENYQKLLLLTKYQNNGRSFFFFTYLQLLYIH